MTLCDALVSGRWEDGPANAIPQDVWDELYANGLIAQGGDQSGESWPVITGAGENALVALIRGDENGHSRRQEDQASRPHGGEDTQAREGAGS